MATIDPLEITVEDDEVDQGLWRFRFHGHLVEVHRHFGYVRLDGGPPRATDAVKGLEDVEELAGEPLAAIEKLIGHHDAAEQRQEERVAPSYTSTSMARQRSRPRKEARPSSPKTSSKRRLSQTTSRRSPEPKPRKAGQGDARDAATLNSAAAALNTKAAARYLGLSPKTLETQRSRGGGPPFVKLGSRVVYREEDLDRWLEERVRRSTSDSGGKQD